MPRFLASIVLALFIAAPAFAQEPPAQIYFFNRMSGEVTFGVDDGPANAVPSFRILFAPITAGSHRFTIRLPDGAVLTETHWLEPSSAFGKAKGGQWLCLVLGYHEGRQRVELVRMLPAECGQLIEARPD